MVTEHSINALASDIFKMITMISQCLWKLARDLNIDIEIWDWKRKIRINNVFSWHNQDWPINPSSSNTKSLKQC